MCYYISVVLSVRLRVMCVYFIEFGLGHGLSIPVIRCVRTTEAAWVIYVTIRRVISESQMNWFLPCGADRGYVMSPKVWILERSILYDGNFIFSQLSVLRVCSVRECSEVNGRSWCDSYCSGTRLKMTSLVSELTSYEWKSGFFLREWSREWVKVQSAMDLIRRAWSM